MTQTWHLAQANLAYLREPMESALLSDFAARLDEINSLADSSPGFVWRYMSDSRNPQDREFDDPLVLFNMTVWQSVEALHHFTYKTAHAQVFAKRAKWFDDWRARLASTNVALWWIAAGQIPSVTEAMQRAAHLLEHGATAKAFTFKRRFSPEGIALFDYSSEAGAAHA
jgi:heme-degrading monooxygenase HmoA